MENGVNGISETAYDVVPANAFETFEVKLTVVPAQTFIVPEGVIVTEGDCAKAMFAAIGKIMSKSLNHFIA
jgi:hypothetical protein